MARFAKRLGLLIAGIVLIVAIGTAAIAATLGANAKSEKVLISDRLDKTSTLAGLTQQFFAFEFQGMAQAAASLAVSPSHEGLRQLVLDSKLLDLGAVIIDERGRVIDSYGPVLAFPSAADPGLAPLFASLRAGKPGLSSVLNAGGTPIVALGVGVPPAPGAHAVLLGFSRAETSPLQQYNERLRYGQTGVGYLVDSNGGVVSSTNPALVGNVLRRDALSTRLRSGKPGTIEYDTYSGRVLAAYAPVGLSGWSVIAEEPARDFFGTVRSGSLRTTLAVLALLVVAAGCLAVFNAKRQHALARAYEYKGELLANTTHELKTPLTAIRGAAMTLGLRRSAMSEDQIDSFLGMIHRRTLSLQKIVDRILTGARLEAGRQIAIVPQPIDVPEIVAQTAAEFVDVSPRHNIETKSEPGLRVLADPAALDQVFGLLLENAIKYSPAGGDIRIEARQNGKEIMFSVADSGVGIPEADTKHVFEAYFKAVRGDRQSYSGVGLGLSIAKHLIERQNGRIWVESEPGVGSVFIFSLPALEPASVEVYS